MSSLYKYKDRVLVESTTTGTGDLTLGAAVSNLTRGVHRTFADAGYVNGDKVKYVIQHLTSLEVETGRGTIGAGLVLQRNIGVNMSSNANALVNFSAGTKHVYVTLDQEFANTDVVQHQEDVAQGSVIRLRNTTANLETELSNYGGVGTLVAAWAVNYYRDSSGVRQRRDATKAGFGIEFGADQYSVCAISAAGVESFPFTSTATLFYVASSFIATVGAGRTFSITDDPYTTTYFHIDANGHQFNFKTAAPVDGAISTSSATWHWQHTPGNARPIFKGKDSAGTAVTFTAASTAEVTAAQTAAQAYADTLVAGLWDYRGNYDASVNTFPASGGSGAAGAVLKADAWTISVAGTLGGTAVTAGDVAIALVDTPGQTASNWSVIENNFGYVPQPLDADLTAIAALTTDAFGRGLLTQVSAAGVRTYIDAPGLGAANEFTIRNKFPATYGDITTDADAATITIDWSAASRRKVTLTANRTIAFSNDVDGQSVVIIFVSGGTGAFVPVWPAGIRWQGGAAPTLTNTSGRRDLVGIYRESSGNYIGTFASNFF